MTATPPVPAEVVAVVSLSRSGSSLLARILQEGLGVDFGETIEQIPLNRNNPDGYFENADVLRLNEDVLAASGASIFDPPPVDYFLRSGAALAPFQERARAILDYHTRSRRRFGFKDPRLSLTLPVWKSVHPGIVPVIVFRDPGASALSIVDQNGIPLERATALWFEYYFRILHYTAGLRRFLTSFERLLSSPLATTIDLAGHLGISIDPDELARRLDAIVNPGRVRHSNRAEPPDFSPYIDPSTKLLYSHLRSAIEAGRQPDYQHLGSVVTGLVQFERLAELRQQEERRREQAAIQDGVGQELAERDRRLQDLRDSLADHDVALATRDESLAERDRQLQSLQESLADHEVALAERDRQLQRLRDGLAERDAALASARAGEDASQRSLRWLRRKAETAVVELDAYRRRRPVRWADRWLSRASAWDDVGPAFQQLKDDSLLFEHRRFGYRLTPSANLQEVACATYAIRPDRPLLAGIRLAVLVDIPHTEGRLGVEIVSPEHEIVAQAVLPLSQIVDDVPVTLSFSALAGSGVGRHWLRVFAREATLPVRVLEWRRIGAGGNGPRGIRAFCGFVFEPRTS